MDMTERTAGNMFISAFMLKVDGLHARGNGGLRSVV